MRVLVPFLALVGLAASAPRAHAEDWTKSYTVSGRATVKVRTDDGGVRVTTSSSKQIEFRVEYEGYKLDKDIHIESRQDGDHVELASRSSSHWCLFCVNVRHRIHIEVRMPQDADLQVDSGDGSVETEAINGNVAVHTGDGSVKARSLNGTIDLHTNDGSIDVDGLKGDIRLRSGDGSIEARNLDGKVDADSGDGHIRLEGRFDGLNIKTGDGSVTARVNSGSKMAGGWNVRTGDGSVDLTIPADFQANIDASTGDGHISLGVAVTVEGTFSNSQIHGKMNGGGQPLTVHTGDGSIRLSKS
ncbi:MAG TPA: DUF4097 family beta strand repeat-containing protein [Candidatus Acidoferrum sp.]|jgi:hypothetical protein